MYSDNPASFSQFGLKHRPANRGLCIRLYLYGVDAISPKHIPELGGPAVAASLLAFEAELHGAAVRVVPLCCSES